MRIPQHLAAAIVIVIVLLAGGVPVPSAVAETGPQVTVLVDRLNLRQGPGLAYPIVGSLGRDTQAMLIGRTAGSDWLQVRLADGRTGWVSGSPRYVRVTGDATLVPVVAAAAPVQPAVTTRRGGTIVFQTSSGGSIYAINGDGTSPRLLTSGIDPALSPDGRRVAFTRWDSSGLGSLGNLWVANVDGSGEQKILDFIRQPKSPQWSLDGKMIALSMQQGGTLEPVRQCIPLGSGFPPSNAYDIKIEGLKLCFTAPADPHWGLELVDAVTGESRNLPRDIHTFGPTWDPARTWRLVYTGDNGLVNLDVTNGNRWPLTDDPHDRTPAFSPDGSRIALSYHQHDHWEIHLINQDGTGRVRLTSTPLSEISAQQMRGESPRQWNNAAPAWSPDGKRLAFMTDRAGKWEIWVMNADGSGQRPLVTAATLSAKGVALSYEGMDERAITWR